MDEVKEAFSRVRQDIDFLYSELNSLQHNLNLINSNLNELHNSIFLISSKIENIDKLDRQTNEQTNNKSFPTEITLSSTDNLNFKSLKPEFLGISIGNEGVPTDRQTNQQTNQQTKNSSYNLDYSEKINIDKAVEVLDSLDNLKKEIRLKFKRLTEQEMTVFSLLYQLSEEKGFSDYKTLSLKLNLTESSIRDYIGRLIKKGIPVNKNKINNKTIQLSISENLKKIVSLSTILQLRSI